MARFEETSAYCFHCQKHVLARTKHYVTWVWFVLSIIFIPLFLVWIVSKIIWRPVTRCSYCGKIIGSRSLIGNKQTSSQEFAPPIENLLVKLDKYSPELRQNVFVFALIFVLCGGGYFVLNKATTYIEDSDKAVKISEAELVKAPIESTINQSNFSQLPIQKISSAKTPSNLQTPKATENNLKERLRWAAEFESRKRKEGFASAKCYVTGAENTILTLKSEAVVEQSSIEVLSKSGYFDDVFEKGFKKLILVDTIGNQVAITH